MYRNSVYYGLMLFIFLSLTGCNSEDIIPTNDFYSYTTGRVYYEDGEFEYTYNYAEDGMVWFDNDYTQLDLNIHMDSINDFEFRLKIEFDENNYAVSSASLFMIWDKIDQLVLIGKFDAKPYGIELIYVPVDLKISNFRNDKENNRIYFNYSTTIPAKWNSLNKIITVNGTFQSNYLQKS